MIDVEAHDACIFRDGENVNNESGTRGEPRDTLDGGNKPPC